MRFFPGKEKRFLSHIPDSVFTCGEICARRLYNIVLFQIPILVDCSGRRLSGSELPPWSISYPANMNHDHVIVDLDLSGKLDVAVS